MEFAECPPRHPFRPLDARSAPRQLRKKRGTRSNGARPTPESWWICSHGTVAPTIAGVCRAIINSSQYLLSSLPRLHDFTPVARLHTDGGFRMLELQLNRLPHI